MSEVDVLREILENVELIRHLLSVAVGMAIGWVVFWILK